MDKLDKAIAEFEDESSDVPFSERITMMGRAWSDNALETMKFIKKNGIKNPVSEDKRYIQEEGIKQFAIMVKMYNLELKVATQSGKKASDIDSEWLQRIKKKESSVGNIVRTTLKANE